MKKMEKPIFEHPVKPETTYKLYGVGISIVVKPDEMDIFMCRKKCENVNNREHEFDKYQ